MRRIATAALVAALAVAGCGGGNKTDDYRSASQKAASDFRQSVAQASAKIPNGSNLKQRVPGIEAYKASVDRLAARLDSLDPPDEVAKLHDEAVADLHALSRDLGSFETAARENAKAVAQPIVARLANDQARLRTVLDQIDRKLSG